MSHGGHWGQMELYLLWGLIRAAAWRRAEIGLILSGEKNREQIELLQLDRGEIRVAEYLVELPPREMLEAKLHEATRMAREGRLRRVQRDDERHSLSSIYPNLMFL